MARTQIVVTNVAVIPKDGTNDDVIDWVRATCYFTDPKSETTIKLYTEEPGAVIVPRGAFSTYPQVKDLDVRLDLTECPVEMPEPLWEPLWYQRRPLQKLIKKQHGVLEAPTGAGKTVMGLLLAAALGQRTLILVHTKDLLSQWQKAGRDVLGMEVGVIGAGEWEESDAPIVVAMVQTIMRYQHLPEEWLEQWGMVLLDEAHRCPAKSFSHVMVQMSAKHIYGVTATPTRRDGHEPQMHAIIGPVVTKVDEDVLVEHGNLVRPSVRMVETGFDSIPGRRMTRARNQWQRQALYQKVISEVATDHARTRLIARKIVKNAGSHQLVLSDRIEHLYDIQQAVLEIMPEMPTAVVTGKMPKREREDTIQAMRDGVLEVMFATQLADEGLDIVNLDVLHLTFPSRALQKLQQKVGRIMRAATGKRSCKVYDYVDSKIPVLRGQAGDRFAWYLERGCRMTGWTPPVMAASIRKRIERIKSK